MPIRDSVTSPVRSPVAARLRRAYRRVRPAKWLAVRNTSGATTSPISPRRQSTATITAAVPTRVSADGMRSVPTSRRVDSTVRRVGDDPAGQLADGLPVVEGHRQPLGVGEHIRADARGDPLAGPVHVHVAQVGEHPASGGDHQHGDRRDQQHRHRRTAEPPGDGVQDPALALALVLEQVVDHQRQRPRGGKTGGHLAAVHQHAQGQRLPLGPAVVLEPPQLAQSAEIPARTPSGAVSSGFGCVDVCRRLAGVAVHCVLLGVRGRRPQRPEYSGDADQV